MPKFRPGDKVQYMYSGVACTGTIRRLHYEGEDRDGLYSVEFGPEVPFADALHNCSGDVPNGRGWWLGESSLTLVQRCEVTWPPKASRRKYKGFEKCMQLKS